MPRPNPVTLRYWHLWKERLEPELAEAAPPEMAEAKRSAANQLATRLLIQSQMLIPQQRWVQPTLAVAKASALMANALWSHEDQEGVCEPLPGAAPHLSRASAFSHLPASPHATREQRSIRWSQSSMMTDSPSPRSSSRPPPSAPTRRRGSSCRASPSRRKSPLCGSTPTQRETRRRSASLQMTCAAALLHTAPHPA
jgi:hypothetical protein